MKSVYTASAFQQMLNDKDNSIKEVALETLAELIETDWAQISGSLIEIKRTLAAFVASKLFYHLESYEESLNFALVAGEYFNLEISDQYVDTLVQTCIDKYISLKKQSYDLKQRVEIPPKYEEIVNKMIQRSIQQTNYKTALGTAIECRRLDLVREIIRVVPFSQKNTAIAYIYDLGLNTVNSRGFKQELLKVVAEVYTGCEKRNIDYINLSYCYYNLDDSEGVAEILNDLILNQDKVAEKYLLAFQIAQDISETENMSFICSVKKALKADLDDQITQKIERVKFILDGKLSEQCNKIFLKHNCKTDLELSKALLKLDRKKTLVFTHILISLYFLNIGTANEAFFKEKETAEFIDKLATLKKLWYRFTFTATSALLFRDYTDKTSAQLFKDAPPGSTNTNQVSYSGGSLYGIGLVHHGTQNQDIINQMTETIKNQSLNQHEQIIHGACLGLGLVGFATQNQAVYNQLTEVLHINQAVSGEAAGLGIGLVMAGSLNQQVIQDLVQFAKNTEHEKIIRALSMALAVVCFNKEEAADVLIQELSGDKDAILRQGACFIIGMAYVGTGSNNAVKSLLRFAVDDVSDDVRRSAVISLGFVMFKQYEQLPRIMNLLALSYNPYVRYGTALAMGIACAGTNYGEALNMLEPMLKDTVDFVRQAAFLGTAMVMQQSTAAMEPKLQNFQKTLKEVYSKKNEDILCKMGALLAEGILAAGGRNLVIRLASSSGVPKLMSCVSLLYFCHFWYWHPLVNMFSLCLEPAAIIGVDQELRIPSSFQFKSNCKRSLYDYPQEVKSEQNKKEDNKEAVVLSVTQKQKNRALRKSKGFGTEGELGSLSHIESKLSQQQLEPQSSILKQMSINIEKPQEMQVEKEKEKEVPPEPGFYYLQNPSRVLDKQKRYIQYLEDNRYAPIIAEKKSGIIFLKDKERGAPDEYLELVPKPKPAPQAQPKPQTVQTPQPAPQKIETIVEEDNPPPEDFIYDDDEQKSFLEKSKKK